MLKELQSLGLDMRVLTEDRREVIIAEDLDDDGEPINVNMEGLEDGVMPSGDYDNTTDDSYTVEDEEDDELDLDDDVPYTLEDAGFSISDPDSMDDSIFE